ncbi:hypothetical protein ACQ10M_15735, partial [Enterococcus faecium]|uniref:hypothetical protein n=1 Tax=Enterococcus faecium TaxID=1352 RepID=UPI00403FAC77
MKKVTREEVASILVKDKYFSKGNYWLKIWQTLVALLGWMIVVLPFIWVIWVFFPLTRPERAKDFFLYAFLSEKKMLYFLIGFFVLIFFSFLITSFVFIICQIKRDKTFHLRNSKKLLMVFGN